MKVIIVGGVAGGASAAARLRRLDEKAQIIIFEKSGYISYANCGLPYYIGGEIKSKDKLTLQTPESFYQRFRIDVKVKHEVVSINRKNKSVKVRNLLTGEEFEESYDKLILSPGAKAIKPEIEGADNKKVFTLRTVEDTFKIDEFIRDNNSKKATIIGGGFIGLEMAENLKNRGLDVTIVQKTEYLMSTIDSDMASILQNYIRSKKIKLSLNSDVIGIKEENNKLITQIKDKECIESDLIIMAIGVMPDSLLAKESELEIGIKGAIITNEYMQTSDKDIYAVGDVIEVKHFISSNKAIISLAGPANKQGRIAADNICGIKSTYKGGQGSSILKMFDMTVASTGLTKMMADRENINSDYIIITSSSHAGYYPNSKSMYIKVVFEKDTGRILGSQIIGFDGVDKRIDVLATAIRANMTSYDLEDLELAYAPPFSSAKDPVNMVGYVISNIIDGKVKQLHWDDIKDINDNTLIIDTRTKYEYDEEHIKNSVNIPVDELRERINQIPKNKIIYLYCHSGLRSYLAYRILEQNGYECYNISGGFGFYKNIVLNEQMKEEGTGPCGLIL